MSFNPFGGFPATLTAIPHFAMGKFHQAQEQQSHHHHQAGGSFVALPSHQAIQIAVSTVDTSQLGQLANNHPHFDHGQLQMQNQMLSNLLTGGKGFQQQGSKNTLVKSEAGNEGNGHHHQQMMDQKSFHQLSALQQQQLERDNVHQHQDFSSLNDYLSRFSGPPTFPFQQMYKYPAELVQAVQINNQQQGDPLLNDSSSQTLSPDLQSQVNSD